jgi:hypothetical protein
MFQEATIAHAQGSGITYDREYATSNLCDWTGASRE